jgi:hypothetical protein
VAPALPLLNKKAIKKLLFDLTKEVILFSIKNKIMDEFVKQGLQEKYKEEIEAWFVYLDQQEFGKELEEKMMTEVERYMEGKKTIEELINETFPQPKIEWEINLVESIPQNYFFKSALGYA